MKKGLYFVGALALLMSCNQETKTEKDVVVEEVVVVEEETVEVYPYFAGKEFDQEKAMSEAELAEVVANFEGDEQELTFTTQIIDNCENKGCWMNVSAGEEKIRVSFKDYDFFVPLDAAGHQTTLNGVLYYDTLTVDQLRHFAMDANASEDSIATITEPVLTLSYEATGVYVQ